MRDSRTLTRTILHWQAAGATLELLHFVLGAKAAALFTAVRSMDGLEPLDLSLVVAQNVTQTALDSVHALWASARGSLLGGQPSGDDEPPFLLLPCHDERGFAGLVYLEGPEVFRRSRLALLVPLAPFLARVLHRLDGAEDREDAVTPADLAQGSVPAEATQLQFLLDHNEWNIARVARILGVTRMTIYNRLRRLAVPRRRVAKGSRVSELPRV